MIRYICTGECKGVSDVPGVCKAAVCEKAGEPLTPYEDTDGELEIPNKEAPKE